MSVSVLAAERNGHFGNIFKTIKNILNNVSGVAFKGKV